MNDAVCLKSELYLREESEQLSKTLLKIEAICAKERAINTQDAFERAQSMIIMLQQRIERLQRISKGCLAT